MSTSTLILSPADFATLVILGQGTSPEGGTLDLHISHQGDNFAPKRPTYVIGGVVKSVTRPLNYFRETQPDWSEFFSELVGMIEEGIDRGATTVGWWLDEGIVYFDAGTDHDVESTQLGWVLAEAHRRNEKAVGLYVGGKFSTELYV